MYLVDTSVWIDAAANPPRKKGILLAELFEKGVPLHLTGVILQEFLQGASDEIYFQRYKIWLGARRFVHPRDPIGTYAAAARLYAECRWQGITPRSPNDCLIAQLAIEHELLLLQDDADFEKIALVEPRLKLA